MHDRGHKGLKERVFRPFRWLRRNRRRALWVAAVLAVVVPLGSDAALRAMGGSGWSGLGGAFGSGVADELEFDEVAIDEPSPDEVVDAGYAPDPEFFSDDEIISGLGDDGIPDTAVEAYIGGADLANAENPDCGIPWSVLAAIGRVESDHGRFGGSMLRVDGYTTKPIRGIPLDGRDGVALIEDTDGGAEDGDTRFDRAVGPMQIIPTTWKAVAVDGNDDGYTDLNNIFDAAGGAGIYLCNGDVDLTEPGQLARAVRRYNHTDEYVRVVLQLAAAYDSGEIAPGGVDPATLGETPMDPYVFQDFEFVDPADGYYPYYQDERELPPPAPAAPTAPAPTAPAPTAPAPTAPAPTAPAPTTTSPPPPAPTTTTQPPPPTTQPTGPSTTQPTAPTTTQPTGPTTTEAPPTTEAPAPDPDEIIPPASVGWSPTMLDFVTTTVERRAAECSAPEPSPAPTQPSAPAPNPPCPGTPPDEQG